MLSDEGESLESNGLPSEQLKRSLEEQLASVIEGEGILISGMSDQMVHGGEGIYLVSEPNIIQLNRPRRKRHRFRARGFTAIQQQLPEGVGSSISVGSNEQLNGGFKVSSIHIVYGEHDRSPFVVSLRGMSLSNELSFDDERVSFSEASSFDVEPASVPSVSTLGSMANDLYLGNDRIDTDDQFTSISDRPSALSGLSDTFGLSWNRFTRTIGQSFEKKERPLDALLQEDVAPEKKHHISLQSLFKSKPKESSQEASYVLEVEDDRIDPPQIATLDLQIDPEVFSSEEIGPSDSDRVRPPQHASVYRPRIIRSLATLSLLILIAMLPANIIRLVRDLQARQAAVAATSDKAISALNGLQANGELQNSIDALRLASGEFRNADKILSETNALAVGIANLLPSTHSAYSSARALMEIGEKTTNAGQLLAKGLDEALSGNGSILQRIASVRAYVQGALPLLEDAAEAFATIDSSVVPEGSRTKVEELGAFVEDGRSVLKDFIGMSDLVTVLLGKEESRRYLVIFQNPSELRATGGFIGSFAELDVDQGEIVRLEVPGGGSYDLKGDLVSQVAPPKPLQLIASRWEFQDSNWSPDFPTAAKKIRWFWSKSGGYSVDGVIAVNSTIVEKLLTVTGPIDVSELGKNITSENFVEETQKAVELEYDKAENKPKKILALLAPRLLERIKQFNSSEMIQLVSIVSESMENKDIQIALTNAEEDAKAQSYGWSGRLKETKGDTLAIIGSNVAGQKTDSVINEHVTQEVKISEDGRMTDRVTLTRTHTGTKGAIFSGVRNVEYFRFYVPRGSTLVDASGFDVIPTSLFKAVREDAQIDPDLASSELMADHTAFNVSTWDEGDRTVIGGWAMLDPGQEEKLVISYRLPFTAYDLRDRVSDHGATVEDGRSAYELLLTSQSGKPGREIDVSVEVPQSWDTHWIRSPESVDGVWNRDRVVSALFETK